LVGEHYYEKSLEFAILEPFSGVRLHSSVVKLKKVGIPRSSGVGKALASALHLPLWIHPTREFW
jgi:hypothetical protein